MHALCDAISMHAYLLQEEVFFAELELGRWLGYSDGKRVAATARGALGWYIPSVGAPRDVGCRAVVVYVANSFSVQFSLQISYTSSTRPSIKYRSGNLSSAESLSPLLASSARGRYFIYFTL